MAVTAVHLEKAPKRISILGATGSVGRNTVDLIRRNPGSYAVEALTANRNADLLAQQARQLGARLAVVADEGAYADLKAALSGSNIEAAAGRAAIVEAATRPDAWVMAAIVGAAGLEPVMAAIKRGAVIALANKESLVCAGPLMTAEVRRSGATLLPVDSEHNAVFQVFDFDHPDRVEQIILTASGGPFREKSTEQMRDMTPEQAIAHPNWCMGAKISVDSATMMNKGLELIEAFYLFPLDEARIKILVHPQSVIHSMVAYSDGSVLAQMGVPDMRVPIAYCLAWPHRMAAPVQRLDLATIGKLTFEAPDEARFPALGLARRALQSGGAAPTILNAANEEAVHGFLEGRCGFLDISRIVEDVLGAAPTFSMDCIEDVIETSDWARRVAREVMETLRKTRSA